MKKEMLDIILKERKWEDENCFCRGFDIPDFKVEVPEGKNPVVLQLTDTQIIDAGQSRSGRGGFDRGFWATDKVFDRCYNYIKEVILATTQGMLVVRGDGLNVNRLLVEHGEVDIEGRVDSMIYSERGKKEEALWKRLFS